MNNEIDIILETTTKIFNKQKCLIFYASFVIFIVARV